MKSIENVLVIIPAYNEEKSIIRVTEAAARSYPGIDILVINDRSTDDTESVLQESHINHITLPVNLGIGGAVQTGFLYAISYGYDVAMQVDGDGQHPPEQIPLLLEAMLKEDCDVVIGSRYLINGRNVSTFARRMGGAVLSALIFIATGKKLMDPTSGFRAYNRRVLHYLSQYYPQEYPEPISALELLEQGFKVKEIPVEMKERQFGRSSITGLNTLFYMIKVIFAIIIVKLRRRES